MKVLHITTSISGGAGVATYRIHQALLEHTDIESHILVPETNFQLNISHLNQIHKNLNVLKPPTYPSLTLKNYVIEKILKRYKLNYENYLKESKVQKDLFSNIAKNTLLKYEIFTHPFSNYNILESPEYKKADIIHLHWIANFIDYKTFFEINTKPIVWTFHDENPYRGAFHYESDELKNVVEFGEIDKEYKKIKNESIQKQNCLIAVSPSSWLKQRIQESATFKNRNVFLIRYAINPLIYKTCDTSFSRKMFNIPKNKFVFLFVADNILNNRKGFDLLQPLIKDSNFSNDFFIVVGKKGENTNNNSNVLFTGKIHDERIMALLYNSADFFIIPSREDNFPNTTIESLCCGTPVIAFPIGDNNTILKKNIGIVCDDISTESLQKAMLKAKQTNDLFNKNIISQYAHELCNPQNIATAYEKIYNSIL